MRIVVRKTQGRWLWDCHRCQGGEYHSTWRGAFAEAITHRATHRRFGFR